MNLQDKHIKKLKNLCDTYHVEKMYLFGSALTPNFNAKSDLDFLVRFKQIDLAEYFDNYIDLKENLKELFGREIDLVEEQTLRNPILINSIDKNKELVYG
ncbi:nucleotidyltransferase family protein [Psychroflexus planctonicus]|uniref:Nucleotidyltransferase n=1 Tax=Psychroflexus planctonicus TaxID=1526575 RepID=A0ABQ1SHQ9_9FLAO|nr:nucleotidyltransferase domain-containing protein [Psychroflexus planctonicus]GGE35211.1 nucleotidyltransferase [Psychroflexus planctonicus]